MKKVLALLLTAAMAAGMLAGCGGTGSSTSQSGSAAAQSTSVPEEQTLEGSLISTEPKTFTIFLTMNNMPFDSEWAVWQEAGERTNIYLEGSIPQSNSNEEEAFNLMVSSGELADIIGHSSVSEMEKLGRDGGLIPLNDLIDQYAPNIKKTMEEDSTFRQACYSLDGKIYQIPKTTPLLSAEYWWIRQDWLDKLGLEVPTTVDELYDVLTAFRNEDPNDNGQKDEIPLFDRAGDKMPDEYLYLWDTSTEFYVRDGKVVFEPLEENFEIGVNNLSRWYQEGLIDPEIFTRGKKSRDTLLGGDLGGMTHDWVSTGNYNDSLQEDIPGFEMVAIAPPADQNGNVVERTTRYPSGGWGISSTCEDPVTVIKFMDYMFSDEGAELMNWGIEGETFTYADDGSRQYTDTVLKSELGAINYLRSQGIQYRIGMKQDAGYEYATMNEAGTGATKLYNDHPEWFRLEEPPYLDGALDMKYPPELEAEYQKLMADIRPYVDEKFQSWMLGTASFEDDYDAFVEELKSRGIDRAIEINQIAYDTYIGNANQ